MLNEEILAINQDPSTSPARLFHAETNQTGKSPKTANTSGIVSQSWVRAYTDGSYAVCLFNRGETVRSMSVSWSDLGVAPDVSMKLRDAVEKTSLGVATHSYTHEVQAHASLLMRLNPATHSN